jgi:hypothetical protein
MVLIIGLSVFIAIVLSFLRRVAGFPPILVVV